MSFTAELVDLQLGAVALCNQGANSRADIIFTKRKEQKSMPNTFEELMKSLNAEHAKMIQDYLDGVNKTHEETLKGLQDKIDALEKSAKPAATEEPTPDVMKSLPAEVQKKFDDMQATINAMVTKQAEDLAAARFEKCKALPVEEGELKDVLKAASPAVVSILEKAAAALASSMHTPAGSDASGQMQKSGADSYYSVLEKSAKDIMAKNAGMTFEAAFTAAVEADPDTYAKYAQEV